MTQGFDLQALPPKSADVVVIGGGIVGCSTAYFLAKQGIPVVLCEKGRIAGEQSSRNWGWVRQQGRDAREVPAIMESLRIWRGLEAELDEDVGFEERGVFYMAHSDEEMDGYDTWLTLAKQYGIESRRLSASEVGAHLGMNDHLWRGALYTPSDGRAEPAKAAPAIARGIAKQGGTVLVNCAVRGLELEAGRVAGVVTERGTIKTQAVVCAAGAWSSLFSGSLGIRLPQTKVRGSVARTSPVPELNIGAISEGQVALRRRQDGGYTLASETVTDYPLVPDSFRYFSDYIPAMKMSWKELKVRIDDRFFTELTLPRRWALDEESPFERMRVLDPKPNDKVLDRALAAARARFPQLGEMTLAERWAGLIDVLPDLVPVISPVESLPGFILATGFSGHGFGLGPGAGLLTAELASGAKPTVDLSPFRYSRFTDGSRPRPESAL